MPPGSARYRRRGGFTGPGVLEKIEGALATCRDSLQLTGLLVGRGFRLIRRNQGFLLSLVSRLSLGAGLGLITGLSFGAGLLSRDQNGVLRFRGLHRAGKSKSQANNDKEYKTSHFLLHNSCIIYSDQHNAVIV